MHDPSKNSAAELADPGKKKVFEVHFEALKDGYKELIDLNQKIILILLGVVGWFSAKDNPLEILCRVPGLAHVAVAFTAAGLLVSAHLFRLIQRSSDESYRSLVLLGYETSLFQKYRLTSSMYWAGMFGQFTLILGIAAFIVVRYISAYSVCAN